MSVSSPSSPSTPVWPPTSSAAFPRIGSLPAYVFAQINAEKRERMDAGEDVIDLGMGNPDLGTPGHIVAELMAHSADPEHHRYSASRGIPGLREGIAEHYREKYGVELDPETEVVVTIGAKEGIAHLMLAILGEGDTVLVPAPAYPIHTYSVVFAGGTVKTLPLAEGQEGYVDADALLASVEEACRSAQTPPRVLVLSFPNNPTTLQAPPGFFERAVEMCRRNQLLLIHDFAYADGGFGEDPPSVLAVPGARDIAVEFFSMSKSYSMPGWRVGFCVGNPAMVGALTKIKSYLDYGIFQPIQIAAAHALRAGQECVGETREVYRRRAEALVRSLRGAGWDVTLPRATMFVWTRIPEAFRGMPSIDFARFLLAEAGVVVSPGVGFGPEGEGYVRFALIEPESRLAEAGERIARALARGPAKV